MAFKKWVFCIYNKVKKINLLTYIKKRFQNTFEPSEHPILVSMPWHVINN
jgi:hypothetical protein